MSSGEVWTFEANAGPMLNAVRSITNEQQLLERQIKANAEAAQKGSALAKQAVEQDLAASYKLSQQKKQIFEDLKKLDTQTTKNSASLKSMGGNHMIIQQLAFAADDAAISFGTGGFAGAMRGAANNLSMVAMMISPVAGAIAGIGLAVGGVFVRQWEEAGKATEKAKEKVYDFRKELEKLDERVLKSRNSATAAAQMAQQLADAEVLQGAREVKGDARQRVVNAQIGLKAAQAAFDEAKGRPDAGGKFGGVKGQAEAINVNVAKEELFKAQEAEKDANIKFIAIDKKLREAQQGEGFQRLGNFGQDVRKKFGAFAGDFGGAFQKKAKDFDPFEVELRGARLNADKARQAVNDEELAARGPARGPKDKVGEITKDEKKTLDALDRAAKAMENLVNQLEIQKKERDNANMLKRPAHG